MQPDENVVPMERPRVGVLFFLHPYLVSCERFDVEREAFIAGLSRKGLSVGLRETIGRDTDLERVEQKIDITQIDLLIYPCLSRGVEGRSLLIARQTTLPLVLVCDEGPHRAFAPVGLCSNCKSSAPDRENLRLCCRLTSRTQNSWRSH